MPITRRKRANPPDQPENNTNQLADQSGNSSEMSATDQATSASGSPAETERPLDSAPTAPARPDTIPNQPSPILPPASPPLPPSLALAISEQLERNERGERGERERSNYTPIEGGRRTARGELFRRPPQPPPTAPPFTAAPSAAPPSLQPPSHEIKLPLGKEPGDSHGDPLHLAYNPSYTGAEGARNALLQQLANESKAGGRARCWNCGSLAIVYDRWSTRSKTLGEIGIAFCEICGVWSVM